MGCNQSHFRVQRVKVTQQGRNVISVVLRGYTATFRAQSNFEKRNQGDMKFLPENIKVFYFASDCVEPYVEVGLCWIDREIEI